MRIRSGAHRRRRSATPPSHPERAAAGLVGVAIALHLWTTGAQIAQTPGGPIGRCAFPSAVAAGGPGEGNQAGAWTTLVACDDPAGEPVRGPARLLFGERLDLNRVGAGALEVLPGIGPARARAIVEERARRRFDSLDELTRVHGIGRATLEKIRAYLEVPEQEGPAIAPTLEAGASPGALAER